MYFDARCTRAFAEARVKDALRKAERERLAQAAKGSGRAQRRWLNVVVAILSVPAGFIAAYR